MAERDVKIAHLKRLKAQSIRRSKILELREMDARIRLQILISTQFQSVQNEDRDFYPCRPQLRMPNVYDGDYCPCIADMSYNKPCTLCSLGAKMTSPAGRTTDHSDSDESAASLDSIDFATLTSIKNLANWERETKNRIARIDKVEESVLALMRGKSPAPRDDEHKADVPTATETNQANQEIKLNVDLFVDDLPYISSTEGLVNGYGSESSACTMHSSLETLEEMQQEPPALNTADAPMFNSPMCDYSSKTDESDHLDPHMVQSDNEVVADDISEETSEKNPAEGPAPTVGAEDVNKDISQKCSCKHMRILTEAVENNNEPPAQETTLADDSLAETPAAEMTLEEPTPGKLPIETSETEFPAPSTEETEVPSPTVGVEDVSKDISESCSCKQVGILSEALEDNNESSAQETTLADDSLAEARAAEMTVQEPTPGKLSIEASTTEFPAPSTEEAEEPSPTVGVEDVSKDISESCSRKHLEIISEGVEDNNESSAQETTLADDVPNSQLTSDESPIETLAKVPSIPVSIKTSREKSQSNVPSTPVAVKTPREKSPAKVPSTPVAVKTSREKSPAKISPIPGTTKSSTEKSPTKSPSTQAPVLSPREKNPEKRESISSAEKSGALRKSPEKIAPKESAVKPTSNKPSNGKRPPTPSTFKIPRLSMGSVGSRSTARSVNSKKKDSDKRGSKGDGVPEIPPGSSKNNFVCNKRKSNNCGNRTDAPPEIPRTTPLLGCYCRQPTRHRASASKNRGPKDDAYQNKPSVGKKNICKCNQTNCKSNQMNCKCKLKNCKCNQMNCKCNQKNCKYNQKNCKCHLKSCKCN